MHRHSGKWAFAREGIVMWPFNKKELPTPAKREMSKESGSVTLNFHRNRSFRGHLRQIKVYLDREPVISIGMEENISYQCGPGIHTVFAGLDSLKSQYINLQAAENAVYSFEVTLTMEEGLLLEMKSSDS